ncbi:hypothetical protein HY30_06155 [Hyphomonas chukchiensis]|uniref:Uncharacterized protein n=1 Tax=Hyphomonas chukchiensis TaxID=1280947 RepID=A0A062U8Q5_9PROT|nr:hypothetical protein HY30_06155 [Hyphomonas chukchiensis]
MSFFKMGGSRCCEPHEAGAAAEERGLMSFAAVEPAATTDKQSRPTPTCDIIGRCGHDRCRTCEDGAGHLSCRGSGFDVVETRAGGHFL